nr:hypothetical protein [Tanacetum cinerariifolium]
MVANSPPTAYHGGANGWKIRRCCCGAGGGGIAAVVGVDGGDNGAIGCWFWREVDMVTRKWPEMVAGGSGCHGGEERRCIASVGGRSCRSVWEEYFWGSPEKIAGKRIARIVKSLVLSVFVFHSQELHILSFILGIP